MLEILILNLKPGAREKFHQLFVTESVPLQEKWQIEVMAYGPSLHDENSYYVMRSFKSLEDRQKKEDDFYGSDDWRKGPRAALLALIENDIAVVVPEDTIRGGR